MKKKGYYYCGKNKLFIMFMMNNTPETTTKHKRYEKENKKIKKYLISTRKITNNCYKK